MKAADAERTYGSSNPQFALVYTGLKNNESAPAWVTRPSISCSADETSPVGTYDITVSNGEARNYTVSLGRGTLTVSKAPLRITANNISRLYYEPNPDFTCIYSGFVKGETSSVLTRQPQITTTAVLGSKVGNYDFVYSNGSLIIEKAYQTMNWDQDLDKISLYSQVELTAEASLNLPVTYQVDNDSVCNLIYISSKTYIDCFHYGKAVISAYQPGNNNYWPTTKSYKVLTVSDPSGIKAVVIDGKLTGRIHAANSTVSVPSLAANETLSIYTLTGKLVTVGTNRL